MYYLDYDSGRLYEDVSRTRLVESIAVKYGDTVTLPLLVLDTAGKVRDMGTDVLRFGARLNGVQVLLVDGAKYMPTMSGTVVSPAYEMIIPINTTPIKTALTNRPCVCLDGEFERETYTGWHVSSQTVAVHVQADVVDVNTIPAVDATAPLATERWVREIFSGVVAGTLPGFGVDSTTITAPGTQATVTLDYIESQGKYGFKFYIPKTPGEPGAPGATPTFVAGNINLTNPGSQAIFGMRTVGVNTYAIDLSLPLNKGEPGAPGVTPTFTVGTVTTGAEAAVTVVPVGSAGYKLNFVLPRGAQGAQGERGLQGVVPPVQIGTVQGTESAQASLDYDAGTGYHLNLGLPRGIQGVQGIQGAIGPAPTIKIGYVYSQPAAAASLTPDGATGYKLNLELPRGDRGYEGATGPAPTLVKGTTYVLTPGSDPYFDVRASGTPGKYYIDMGLPSGAGEGGGTGTPAEAYILSVTYDATLTLTCRTDDPSSLHPHGTEANVPLNYHTHSVNHDGYTCRRTYEQGSLSTGQYNGLTMANQPPPDMMTAAQWYQDESNTSTNYYSGAHHTHIVDGPGGQSYATTGPSGEIWWALGGEGGICMQEHQHAVLIPS